jgi:hypothetical protein
MVPPLTAVRQVRAWRGAVARAAHKQLCRRRVEAFRAATSTMQALHAWRRRLRLTRRRTLALRTAVRLHAAMGKLMRIVTVGVSGGEIALRGRFATPADSPRHDGSPYRGLHVRRERLEFVHRSRAILCRPVPMP